MSIDYLHGVEVVEVDGGTRPIRTAKAAVIGVVGTAGKGMVNKSVLVTGSQSQAIKEFGEYHDDGFTLPEVFDGIFDHGGATVVAINVCDPAKHFSEMASVPVMVDKDCKAKLGKPYVFDVVFNASAVEAPAQLVNGTLVLADGVSLSQVQSADGNVDYIEGADYTVSGSNLNVVQGGALGDTDAVKLTFSVALVKDQDFVVDSDHGEVVFNHGAFKSGAEMVGSFKYVDPSKVTQADVIGAIEDNGQFTGVQLFKSAKNDVYVSPRILIAPYFTGHKADKFTADPVAVEMVAVADQIRAIAYADAPNTTDVDAVAYRKDFGSKRIVVCDPYVKVMTPDGSYKNQPRSIRRAGLAAKVISDQGFHVLPSNQLLQGVVGLSRPVTEGKNGSANYLNENEVATCLRLDGFREWGGRTCSSDSKWAFESAVRTADMIQDAIVAAHLWAVDKNINKNLGNAIVESVNAFLRDLKNRGVILGGKAWLDAELNSPELVAQGIFYVDFDFTAHYPAEHIIFRSRLVNDYISEVFA